MTPFRTLADAALSGKRVLTRVDLNVPMEHGAVSDATRIERVLPTIRYIAGKGGKVMSRFATSDFRSVPRKTRVKASATSPTPARATAHQVRIFCHGY